MQLGVLQDSECKTRHGSKKPYWSRSLEGLGTLGRLGLKGLLLFVVPNLLSSGSRGGATLSNGGAMAPPIFFKNFIIYGYFAIFLKH